MTTRRTTEEIKRDFPECCAVVDEFRAVFGPEVKPTYMSEGGNEVGRSKSGDDEPTAVPVSKMVFQDKEEEETKQGAAGNRRKQRR